MVAGRGTSCVQERGRAAGTWPKPPHTPAGPFPSQGSQPSGGRRASANAERTNHGAFFFFFFFLNCETRHESWCFFCGCVEAPC